MATEEIWKILVDFYEQQSTIMSDLRMFEQTPITMKCEICDKDFKSSNSLRNHFNNDHNYKEEHQCNICQKKFKIHRQLILHEKLVHENKKVHKCDSCGKSFSQPGVLNGHILSM